ncbi:hypothetical protein C9994_10670 [Marivirga lumbricoides]|uniref:Uncharacterized protein n=1 Tax=Marivirga lumbricoides TaxID=1046115 RepID=A0A2T4DPE3_9BACT|nr:hypothetical protein C9994_10670 [Marivirga lumbricoides]
MKKYRSVSKLNSLINLEEITQYLDRLFSSGEIVYIPREDDGLQIWWYDRESKYLMHFEQKENKLFVSTRIWEILELKFNLNEQAINLIMNRYMNEKDPLQDFQTNKSFLV